MSQVRVRNLEDWVVEAFKARAKRQGQSVEAMLRELLRVEASRPKMELAAELERLREAQRDKYGTFTDSTPLIRAEREQLS
jgi:plasmid stability protein